MYAENKKMNDCANTCLECFTVCTQTIPQCLDKGGDHALLAILGFYNSAQMFANYLQAQCFLELNNIRTFARLAQKYVMNVPMNVNLLEATLWRHVQRYAANVLPLVKKWCE